MIETIESYFISEKEAKPACPRCKNNGEVQSRLYWMLKNPTNPISLPLVDWRCNRCNCEFF